MPKVIRPLDYVHEILDEGTTTVRFLRSSEASPFTFEQGHPIDVLRTMISERGFLDNHVYFRLHAYKQVPRQGSVGGSELHAKSFAFHAMGIEDGTLEKLLGSLVARGYDVALRSDFEAAGEEFHIPMIDFAMSVADAKNISIATFEKQTGLPITSFRFYASGRSFHAYSVEHEADFHDWMSRLLLMNQPYPAPPLTDTRWVGHRLRLGRAALRWTKTNPSYVQFPTEIDCPFK
jgi:hypothetical protein